ncbi:hypothetical protein FA13DRAFT_1733048 [Coprinellus micaceus]|uniref:Uncharacterized protein n=1 Tax=Coprinellus micaceus TaxID=71717 RepID=A0A4Y7TAQ9_COPMI|nr:hypothetical protein FA13DRAFT_1733048 [Coprinellus micaceus]
MAEQQSTPNPSDDPNEVEIPFDSVGLTIKHAQDRDETKLGELRVSGLDGEHWKSFELYEASPGKWRMSSRIEFPPGVAGIRCAVNWEGGEGYTVIPAGRPGRGGDIPEGDVELGNAGKMLNAQLALPASSREPIQIAVPQCKRLLGDLLL